MVLLAGRACIAMCALFPACLQAKRTRGMGVVGSTSNILDFIAAKVGGHPRGGMVVAGGWGAAGQAACGRPQPRCGGLCGVYIPPT